MDWLVDLGADAYDQLRNARAPRTTEDLRKLVEQLWWLGFILTPVVGWLWLRLWAWLKALPLALVVGFRLSWTISRVRNDAYEAGVAWMIGESFVSMGHFLFVGLARLALALALVVIAVVMANTGANVWVSVFNLLLGMVWLWSALRTMYGTSRITRLAILGPGDLVDRTKRYLAEVKDIGIHHGERSFAKRRLVVLLTELEGCLETMNLLAQRVAFRSSLRAMEKAAYEARFPSAEAVPAASTSDQVTAGPGS